MARKPDSLHVLPLFCDDLIASCVDMTPACFGAYMRLLCYAWTRGGVPDEEAACSRITGGMEPGDWAAIRSRLLVLDDGRLTHQRLELERVAVSEIREKRAEAGRMGGRPKANGKQTESKTKANEKQNESKTKAPYPSPSLPYTREEIQPASPVAPSTPQRRRCSKPADPLRWSAESGWEGITDADHAEWSQAYPAADLPVELAKANQWLKANPKKARKSNWRRWLTTVWLSKCQDRGGTHREAARQPAPQPVDQAKKRYWRGDAGQNMTEREYAVWRKDQRAGGVATALATTLKLKDENT